LALGVDEGEGATDGVAEDGRDQPGPVVDAWGVAVSFVVTKRECDAEFWAVGRAAYILATNWYGVVHYSQIDPPAFAETDVVDVWLAPEADEVFSKNFLLMFIALNRFG
jgi:hypothetical protein